MAWFTYETIGKMAQFVRKYLAGLACDIFFYERVQLGRHGELQHQMAAQEGSVNPRLRHWADGTRNSFL